MPDTVQDLIRQEATKAGVPIPLALAVAEQESGFNPTVVGPKLDSGEQAVGTFQVLPSTAKARGFDPYDPRENIRGGVGYLRELLDQNKGDLTSVLKTYGGVVKDESYVPSVLGRLGKFKDTPAPAPAAKPTFTDESVPIKPTPKAAPSFTQSLIQGVSPFNPTGRRNLAGMAGAGAVTYASGGLGLPWYLAALGPAIGAATGGAAEEATEQTIGSKPSNPSEVGSAGLEQGAYELSGQAFLWPLRRVGKSLIATKVGTSAREALTTGIETAKIAGRDLITSAQEKVAGTLDAVRQMARDAIKAEHTQGSEAVRMAETEAQSATQSATKTAAEGIAATRKQSAEAIAKAELDAADTVQQAQNAYSRVEANPPSTQATGELAKQVFSGLPGLPGETGPAKRALDLAGQRIVQAAEQGPAVTIAPVKDAIDSMAAATRPAGYGQAPTQRGVGFLSNLRAVPSQMAASVPSADPTRLRALVAQQLGIAPEQVHPNLPGVLGEIANAGDTVSFADAHRWKRVLDEAVNWDRTAKKHLEGITKGARTALREQMRGFAPYDQATAAYGALVPLYRKGIGKQVIQAAATAPDRVAQLLSAKSPAAAQALKDLIVSQRGAGGDAALGQQAWDSIRANFTYNNIIKGGVEGLSDRIQALTTQSPEFAKVVFGDPTAVQVLSNLDRIGKAYQTAVESTGEHVAATKTAGKTAIETAKTTGRAAVQSATDLSEQQAAEVKASAADAIAKLRQTAAGDLRQWKQTGASEVSGARLAAKAGVNAASETLARFKKSSVAPYMNRTLESQGADVLRGFGLGPGSIWGALSIVRLLGSPSGKDLLEWAAYSPANTQRIVQVLTSPVPSRVAAGVIRDALAAVNPPISSHAQQPAAPTR